MSEEGNGGTQKITFEFRESPDYRMIPANGAFGGITSKGEIVMNLFMEQATLPRTIVHGVQEGKLGPEESREPGGATLTRLLQAGVVMTPEAARSIATWLMGKVEEIEKLKKQGQGNG